MDVRRTDPRFSSPPTSIAPTAVLPGPPALVWQLSADFMDWRSMRALLGTSRQMRVGMLDAPLSEWRRAARAHLPARSNAPFDDYTSVWRAFLRYDIAQRNMESARPQKIAHHTFSGEVRQAVWSPNGEHVAIVAGNALHIWRATGEPVARSDLPGEVYNAAWSPDGRFCAGGGMGGVLSVIDLEGGVPFNVPHLGTIYSVAWSPDSTRVVARNSGISVHIVDAPERRVLGVTLHQDAVHGVAWSPDGALLSTACADGMARVCHGSTGKAIASHQHRQGAFRTPDHLVCSVWSPDGARVVNLGGQGSLSFITATGVVRAYELGDYFSKVTWSLDGGRLLFQGERGILSTVVDAPTDTLATQEKEGAEHYAALRGQAIPDQSHSRWSADGRHILCLHNRTVTVLDSVTLQPVLTDTLTALPAFMEFSPDSRFLAIGVHCSGTRVWRLSDQSLTAVHTGAVHSATWSPNSEKLAVANWYNAVCIIDMRAPEAKAWQPVAAGTQPNHMWWSADGTTLALSAGAHRRNELVLMDYAPDAS